MNVKRIKAELKLKGQTHEEFANSIGLKVGSFTSILNRGKTSIPTLIMICKGLNVSTDYILGLTDKKESHD